MASFRIQPLNYPFYFKLETQWTLWTKFRDCVPCKETDRQHAACEFEILTGPSKIMRWGVPEGRRDENGLLIHDDIPVTDSLTAILDDLNWTLHTDTVIIQPPDPLLEMDRNY
jgi:hypothetical protein